MKPVISALLLLAALPCSAAEIKTADPAARGYQQSDFPRLKQLAPRVWSYEALRPSDPGKFKTTADMIVVTDAGVLLADGQGNPAEGAKLAAAIKKLTPQPLKYVVVGSEHDDHTGGNGAIKAAFPDAVFIASPASQKALAKSQVPPGETVEGEKRVISLGGTEIDILNLGRAHTGGDLSVYLPGEKILFLSEIYDHNLFPSMARAYPSEWVETIRRNEALPARFVFGGHGFVDDAATMKAGLAEFRQEIVAVIAEVRRLHAAGLSCRTLEDCDAVWSAQWGPYDGWSERPIQAIGAVWRVYQELDGKLQK
jgi:glyoxylase-like metal-dependent hydrolase (beta-lactamase superfamily II)